MEPRDTHNRAIKDTSCVEPLPDNKNLKETLKMGFIRISIDPISLFAFS